MRIMVREETEQDHDRIEKVIKEAFLHTNHTNGMEHELVRELRDTSNFIKELSLVATAEDEIVGHIMMTEGNIKDGFFEYKTLTLAPLSVDPRFQERGVGTTLVKEALDKGKSMGYNSVIVLGEPEFYNRFGFDYAAHFGIYSPFDVPQEYYLVKELVENGLTGKTGIVQYADPFYNID